MGCGNSHTNLASKAELLSPDKDLKGSLQGGTK